MITAAINLTLIESFILLLVVLIFALAIYLFIKSRRYLRQTLKENRDILIGSSKRIKPADPRRNPILEMEQQFTRMRQQLSTKEDAPAPVKKSFHSSTSDDDNISQELKNTIAQQQKLLSTYLRKVEELENEGREELSRENKELQKEILKLQSIIEQKDAEMEELHQEAMSAQKMADKVEEVYKEFDILQNKMNVLEKQASRANSLAIELEDTRHSYEAVHKELIRKQEKLEEIMEDNQRMRQQMNELEDKLEDANLQRQQLHKKVQFLTDLNTDLQSISDTNKKLQTELRRIGELESMLNMMAEERDFLLRNKKEK